MCGIAGRIHLNTTPVRESDLAAMAASLKHRGPDDQGVYIHGNIGLAHTRLSIIDLSSLGHQPMRNKIGTLHIVFNGEIYNYRELREKLAKEGFVFNSHTDTEVILALYEKYGERCLLFLRGMFAFAIWDESRQRLFIARDRIGKKPLKYYFDPSRNIFIFASEIKAILKNPDVPKEVDYEAIDHYLSLQYVPSPFTAFRGIKKLPPAHYLILENGGVNIVRYWEINHKEKLDMSEDAWKRKILDKLRESVRLRMVADVPVGAFLSGGIDSSAIVALMSEQSIQPVHTFSIGFKEQGYDETRFAKIIAHKFKTDHHEFIVEPHATEILSKLIYHYDEPFGDSSAIPTWYLSELTRKYVTVALSGDGGDENFAGYERYLAYKADMLGEKIPFLWRNPLVHSGAYALDRIFATRFTGRFRRFVGTQLKNPYANYIARMFFFTSAQKNLLYSDDFKKRIKANSIPYSEVLLEQLFLSSPSGDWLDRALHTDISSYLPEDLMVKVDIASMAHSLESRSPFLDHEFMELAATVPSSLKIHGFTKKYILKEALRELLPDEILDRPKMGFGVPLDIWFRGELKDFAHDRLLSKRSLERGLFRREAVDELFQDHLSGKVNNAYKLWALVVLEEWFRVWID